MVSRLSTKISKYKYEAEYVDN